MNYRILFIFLEGPDDELFFDRVLKNIFLQKYNVVKFWKYAQKKTALISNFIKNINSMKADKADYIFVVDFNNSICVTRKKQEEKNRYKIIDENKIAVVVKAIESWYLAGLDNKILQEFKIKLYRTTDDINKKEFEKLVPKKFESKINFLMEVLKRFSIQAAKQKNKSFNYFIETHDC